MLTIRAVTLDGQPASPSLQADFDELGGTIGRSADSVLVLPDPERHISRTQATIAWHDGGYVIRNDGSSLPVVVNGRPLGKGGESALAVGDQIQVGGYSLEVSEPGSRRGPPATPMPAGGEPVPLAGAGPTGDRPAPAGTTYPTIPTGFDPFAEVEQPPHEPDTAPAAQAEFDLGPGTAPSIDQLFGLEKGGGEAQPFAPGSPLGGPGGVAEQAMSQDPLVALGAVAPPRPTPSPQRDDAMEIHAAYIPPTVSFGGGKTAPPASAPTDMDKAAYPRKPPPAAPAARVEDKSQAAPPASVTAPQPAPGTAAPPDLLRALLEGAGVPDLDIGAPLTPDTMRALGQLLNVVTQGLLDLLLARALTKSEMGAQVTLIAPRENNPLKFSPSVEVALAYLLAPRGPGFMAPVAAVKDACDDLRAHQFGFMAGMRAALEGVLRRFDPAQLERRLTEKNVLDSLLPSHRKARLWSLFEELYAELTKEAKDDFDALFGREFLRAYQAQLDRLEAGPPEKR